MTVVPTNRIFFRLPPSRHHVIQVNVGPIRDISVNDDGLLAVSGNANVVVIDLVAPPGTWSIVPAGSGY